MIWPSIVIACFTAFNLWLSWDTRRRQREEVRTSQVALVTVQYRMVTTRVPGTDPRFARGIEGHEVAVRNDSEAAISIRGAGFGIGTPHVYEPLPYDPWRITWGEPVDEDAWASPSYVPPGSVAVYRMPSEWSSIGTHVGAIAVFRDAAGRDWRRLPDSWTELPTYTGPRRRWMWCERQPWFDHLSGWAWKVTKRRNIKHPWRTPWTTHLAEWLWGGHRIGASDPIGLPPNAPRSWAYGAEWDPEWRRDWLVQHPEASLGHRVTPDAPGNAIDVSADTDRH